jgi:hypothetical protein
VICRFFHFANLTVADYLQLWNVEDGEDTEEGADINAANAAAAKKFSFAALKDADSAAEPLPWKGSVLANWPEPSAFDKQGLLRYREAFLRENQFWMQHSLEELITEKIATENKNVSVTIGILLFLSDHFSIHVRSLR